MPPFIVACPQNCLTACEEQVNDWITSALGVLSTDFTGVTPNLAQIEALIGTAPDCATFQFSSGLTSALGTTDQPYIRFLATPITLPERTIVAWSWQTPPLPGAWVENPQIWYSTSCDNSAVAPELPTGTWQTAPEGFSDTLGAEAPAPCVENCNCAQNSQFSAREQEAVVTLAMQTRLELDLWYDGENLNAFYANLRRFPHSPSYWGGSVERPLIDQTAVTFYRQLGNLGSWNTVGNNDWLNVVNAGNYSYYTQAQGTTGNGWQYREFYAIPTFVNDRAFTFVVWHNINAIGTSSEWGRTVFMSANNTPYVPSDSDIESTTTPPELFAVQFYDVLNGTSPMNVLQNIVGSLIVTCTCECDVTTALYQFRQAAVYAKDNGVVVINSAVTALTIGAGGVYYDAISGVTMVFDPCFNIAGETGQGGLPETTFRLIANNVNEPLQTYSTGTTGYSYFGLWGGIERPQNTTIALQCGDVADVEKTFTQILGNNSPTQDANYGTEAGFDAYAAFIDTQFTTYLTAGYTTAATTVVNGQGDTEYKRYAYAAGGYTYIHRWVKDNVGNYLVPPTVTRTYDTPNAVPADLIFDVLSVYHFPANETTNLAGVFTLNKL